jgi:Bax protein
MRKILFFIFAINLAFAGFPAYYYKLPPSQQKRAFESILLPMIVKENDKILKEREEVKQIFADPFFVQDYKKMAFLAKMAKKYKIKNLLNKDEFLNKIDTIPPKLVLAQGAVESAWGKSYFARVANNIFGQWTYQKSGIIPRQRDVNATHRIRVFKTLQDSLAVYMRNLNRNPAYKEFRALRAKYRKEHKKFSAYIAATTMRRYSQLGQKYVKIIQNMIKGF